MVRRAARLWVIGLVLSTLLVPMVGVSGTAHADEVAQAQARVDSLQSLVAKTTKELTAGTRAWEQDRKSLRRVELQLRNTRRRVALAQDTSNAAQDRLNALGRRLYTQPLGSAGLLITQSPTDFLEAARAQEMVDRVVGSNQLVMAQAMTARHRLRQQQAEVEALATSAQTLVDRSAATMRRLQALAQSTADQLEEAQQALQTARARRDAARAKAARERAAAAARNRITFAGGPACTGKSSAGQQNGNLDPASLCPLWRAPGHRLRSDAAAAFNKMSQYHAATVGGPLCITDSYRSYSEQVSLYRRKPGLAAVPGTSEHGWGKAVDFCGGIENSGSAAYNWMKANAGRFGWFHPDWAEPSGSKPEAWHWEYGG